VTETTTAFSGSRGSPPATGGIGGSSAARDLDTTSASEDLPATTLALPVGWLRSPRWEPNSALITPPVALPARHPPTPTPAPRLTEQRPARARSPAQLPDGYEIHHRDDP
jgi:hypothetical protein